MFGDKPDGCVGGHPIQSIETREIHRTRVAAQGPLEPQIEVNIEVTHRQLAQGAINGLAITASRKIRFRDRAPVAAHFENRNHVVGVAFRFEIEDQWRESENTKRGRGEDSAFKARRLAFAKNFSWRAAGVTEIVRNLVKKALNAGGCSQCAQFAQLRRRKSKIARTGCLPAVALAKVGRSCDVRS